MKKSFQKLMSIFITIMFTLTLTVGAIPTSVKAAEPDKDKVNEMKNELLSKEELPELEENPEELVRVIVQMWQSPAIQKKGATEKAVIEEQQEVKRSAMALEGANLRHSFGYLVNGFSMDVKRREIPKIEKIRGVKNVREVTIYKEQMTSAKELTQVYKAWEDLNVKGEGMVVSVIDSGIDVSHKDMRLSDENTVKLKETEVQNKKLKGKYYTAKIPYAYNYSDDSHKVLDTATTVSGYMHGMHVAGIVGANGLDEEVKKDEAIQGVAPECQILAMKVFSNNASKRGASSDDIVAAIEDSVKLGADVINMSLGSTCGFQEEDDAEQVAIKNAVDQGVVVVVSAGNSDFSTYPKRIPGVVDTGLVGSPGVAKDTLQVASAENTIATNMSVEFTSDAGTGFYLYSLGGGDPVGMLDNESGTSVVDCGRGIEDEEFENKQLQGKIALIKRGGGSFTDKSVNAQKRGASGVIIWNHENGGDAVIGMAVDGEVVKIPVVSIGNADGADLIGKINDNLKVYFKGEKQSIVNCNKDDMSDFTSWGTAPNLEFKPQISGVGGQIWSTGNTNEGGYLNMSGTSMSAPHVAGAEALILQGMKENGIDLTGRELVEFAKAASINTALPMMDKYHNNVPYSPRRQGAGLIQIKDAITNKVSVKGANNKPTLALKEMGKETSFKVTLKNHSKNPVSYNINSISGVLSEDNNELDSHGNSTMPFDVTIEGAEFTYINENGKPAYVDGSEVITIPANGEKTLTFKISLPNDFKTEQFVEGFIRFESQDKENIPSVGIPFIGFYGEWDKPAIIDAPKWDKKSITHNTQLVFRSANYKLYPVGAVGKDGEGNLIINPDKIAISPNDDGYYDNVTPYMAFLRNARTVSGEITDAHGKVVRTFREREYIRKPAELADKGRTLYNLLWDGKLEDNSIAADGQYYYIVKAKVDFENAEEQRLSMPVKIDNTLPSIEVVSANTSETNAYTLQFKATDAFSGIDAVSVIFNGEKLDKSLITKNGDIYSCQLELIEGYNKIYVNADDVAWNRVTEELIVQFGEVKPDTEAPIIELLSRKLTIETDYTLQLKVADELSGVAHVGIWVNDEEIDESLITKSIDTYSCKLNLKDGDNKIKVTAEDNKNNSDTKEFNVKVQEDKEGPVVEFISPESSESTNYTLKFKLTDELSGIYFFNLYVNGESQSSSSISNDGDIYTCELELNEGSNEISVSAFDNEWNYTSEVFTVKVGDPTKDVTKPEIKLVSSTATNTSKYKLEVEVTDDFSGVSSVSIYLDDEKIDDSLISEEDGTYSCELNLIKGDNKIKVTAEDKNSNEATEEFTVNYDENNAGEDKEGPVVELLSETTSSTSQYTFKCKITDESKVDYISVSLNDGYVGSTYSKDFITKEGDVYSFDLELKEGENKVELTVSDDKFNYTSPRPEFTITMNGSTEDTTKPEIELVSSKATNNSDYTLEVNVTDKQSGVASVVISLNDKVIEDSLVTKKNDSYTCQLQLLEGDNKIVVTAKDNKENTATEEFTVNYDENNAPEDKEGPVVELVSPVTSTTSQYTLKCKITDSSEVKYMSVYLNDERIGSTYVDGTITKDGDIYSCELNLKEGDNLIEVTAKDGKGNYRFKEYNVTYTSATDFTITIKESKIENDTVKVTISAVNPTEESKDVTLIIGMFDDANRLLGYVIEDGVVNSGKEIELNALLDIVEKATNVKYFVWDTLKDMNPYMKIVEEVIER